MKKAIWITYDFGFKGDYEGLYAWLDDHNAEECGNNTALVKYEENTDLFTALKDDLSKNINLSRRDRIYVIWREKEKVRGRFLFGKRKAAPWVGLGHNGSLSDDGDFDEQSD